MKKYLYILLFVNTSLFAQNKGILFENNPLSASLIKAKKENKLVFVDCFTVWCGPCREMAANVFTIDSVGSFFNKNFVNVQLDMEKGEGKPAAIKYHIEAYPSFLLLDGDGNLVYKFVGGMSVREFMVKVKEGINPSNRIATMNKMYADGNRSKDFLREFIKVKINLMEISEGVKLAADYFNMLSTQEKTSPENWFLFGDNRYSMYLSDVHSINFNYLADHWSDFATNNGKDVVEARLVKMYRKITEYCLHGWYFVDYLKKIHPYNKAEFENYRAQINSTDLADKIQLISLMDIAQACGEKDTLKVSTLFAKNFATFSIDNQRLAFTYFSMFRTNQQRKGNLGFEDAIDSMIAAAKDEKLAEAAKKYKKWL